MSSIDSVERPARRPLRAKLPAADLVISLGLMLAFIAMIAFGFWWFRRPGAAVAGNEMNADRAIFMSINAATLTGFQITTPIETYKPAAQVMVLVLTVGGSLMSMMIGGLAVARLLEMHYSVKRVLLAALIAETFAVGLGTAALAGENRSMLSSVMLAASAFGNCGVVIGDAGGIFDKATHLVLLPLAILGGFGLPVLIELYDWMADRREISLYSRSVLVMSAALYVAGVAAIVAVNQPEKTPEDQSAKQVWKSRVLSASVASINARTTGLPLDQASAWPRAMQWIVVVLMFIGASPAGTGGGLKTTTLYELGRGARAALGGRVPGRIFGIAVVWLSIYTILIIVTMTLLLRTETAMPGDRSLFTAVSAAANVGLSLDPISMTQDGVHTLCCAMFLGRFLPWIVLWWSARTTLEADLAVG